MEGRLAVELTDSVENRTSDPDEEDPEEKIFNAIFAEEKEEKLERIRMLVEVELIGKRPKRGKLSSFLSEVKNPRRNFTSTNPPNLLSRKPKPR